MKNCFNWINLRPYKKEKNLKKSNRIKKNIRQNFNIKPNSPFGRGALTTTYFFERKCSTRGNDLGHRNNVKDWVIRG